MKITSWYLEPVVEKQVQPLLPLLVVPLVAVLVERLPECCTKKDEKEPLAPERRVDERN